MTAKRKVRTSGVTTEPKALTIISIKALPRPLLVNLMQLTGSRSCFTCLKLLLDAIE